MIGLVESPSPTVQRESSPRPPGCRVPRLHSSWMTILRPAYLIHGDDHGAVAERRAGLHALADSEGDAASVECLEGETGTPQAVAQALLVMTFAIGQRVIIVDGVERWKDKEVAEHLVHAMAEMPPDTTLALFAREEGRSKAPTAVHQAVKRAGGQISRADERQALGAAEVGARTGNRYRIGARH